MSTNPTKNSGNSSYFDATKSFKDPATGELLSVGVPVKKEVDSPKQRRGTGRQKATTEQLARLAAKFAK